MRDIQFRGGAERQKRATVLQSEGDRLAAVNAAEGRAQAQLAWAEAQKRSAILQAEGIKEKLRVEAEGMATALAALVTTIGGKKALEKLDKNTMDAAMQMMMLKHYYETQAAFSGSNGTKVLMFPTKDSVPMTYEGLQSLLK